MIETVKQAILTHAEKEYPKECCGVIIQHPEHGEQYIPCENRAELMTNFILDPVDYSIAEDTGDVLSIVHSHCDALPTPSDGDVRGCEDSGLPWVIVSWPLKQFFHLMPCGQKLPLIGRVFEHGIVDCYTLVQDYYLQELGIKLPYFFREDEWWERGQNLYNENFNKAGFVKLEPGSEPQRHDVLLMQVQANVTNHAAIYLGNMNILHHLVNRLSRKDTYGGYWQKNTTAILRHKELLNAE